MCMHVSMSGCVSVWQGGVGGAVNSHSCVRSNRRGFQSYLWQTKTKTGGRTRDADRVGDRETKTANDLIVSLSGLIFQANDYHMQTHIKTGCKGKGTDSCDRACTGSSSATARQFSSPAWRKYPPLLPSSLQRCATESSQTPLPSLCSCAE